ncbi:AMP-binding protein [Phenylobacterium aquaticum]|uniref:AMP-binding protein n=1 Tax=Phenylobacterium aquaticum TaxID=1763816 RepID=UPI001F5CBF8A|nr:AMP-binding protein [Phenylobacterium aquaticum]MCI3131943.1 AMP-binding protein [Phenylobacterium aquaticum]
MAESAVAAAPPAPFREAHLLPVDLDIERRPDGTILITSKVPLKPYDANIPAAFARRALASADKPAIAQRGADGEWVFTSFAQLKRDMDAATQWLMDKAAAGPVLILAGNTPAFAVMSFAAQAAGRAACPVSVTYAALGGDYGRLAHVVAKVRPAVVFAEDTAMAKGALETLDFGDAKIITTDPSKLAKPATSYAEVLATPVTAWVAKSIEGLKPSDRAALMLTSGSTGLPKVVPITFDNLMANSTQCQQTIGEAAGWHEVMLDWLPWHHAAGAFVLRTTLLEGGTLYIDDGKPAPGLFETSIRNLREISVSYFNNVPLGYTMLVEAMEKDPVLRANFFRKMRLMLYGGAGLSQTVHDRLQAQAVAETGHRIMMTSGYGMTETVSAFMVIHFETDKVGIGLPAPGTTVKLAPVGDRYEVRAKGPNVTTGYLDEPEKTAAAFDEEGFYRTGDLAVFHDPHDPTQGLAFAGRAAEEFKLSSGTWVYGGSLRDGLLKALSPLVLDLVLCDDGRPYLGVMLWPTAGADPAEIETRLRAFNADQHGGAARVKRALLLTTPPSANAHEISDKGTINRRAVIDGRAGEVERLFAETPDAGVMVLA